MCRAAGARRGGTGVGTGVGRGGPGCGGGGSGGEGGWGVVRRLLLASWDEAGWRVGVQGGLGSLTLTPTPTPTANPKDGRDHRRGAHRSACHRRIPDLRSLEQGAARAQDRQAERRTRTSARTNASRGCTFSGRARWSAFSGRRRIPSPCPALRAAVHSLGRACEPDR